MLSQADVIAIFEKCGALLQGHFLLTSGKHSDRYLQCAQVLQYPEYTRMICASLVEQLGEEPEIDVVVGPAMGGVIVAYEIGRQLGKRALFTEREEGKMRLRRNFSIRPGERVLVVEDVITTGGSVQEVIDVVKAAGGEVVGVAVLVDRSNGRADFGVPLYKALTVAAVAWEPEVCPLCQAGEPAVKPGSRGLK
ncbi:MAG: orotate phosphoribosyltransferase [Bacillota bacterium]|uniref:Orotate phosphoribosyltransferase n=2 Tax=Carboxydocella TaxID=178898 RepID=A0A1T4MXT8_9FIRM|nr:MULTISPECIES: orotate phosphoribosyltransferase [Carboxydocella]AVX20287.1 orotate phosphoribosyltransferase [Carboxydocella thermautotrophica]AVX30711.1 orotate phosphoribosyltransferase [Carboxydocella thermautotrophica]GAW31116.1 orotate phosphoribosyltransferase [Carboxydocella sp. JDF658]SJZ71607.1 orotate phosphoribosyltransferase [Carboxydocella sporoproducens DSM 16521]